MSDPLKPETLEYARRILREHGLTAPEGLNEDFLAAVAMRLRTLQGRNEANSARAELCREQREDLRYAVGRAREAAQAEGADRCRGTDEPREFMIILEVAERIGLPIAEPPGERTS